MYVFSGVFSDGDPAVMEALLKLRPGRGRAIDRPFRGFAVAFVASDQWHEPEQVDGHPLIEWSNNWPEATLVYSFSQDYGDLRDQAGFVIRDGAVLHHEELREESLDDSPLGRLVAFLGVELAEHAFEPVGHGYFDSCR